MEILEWFEHTPLTNFYVGEPITVEDVPWSGTYMTGEHAFQAQKAVKEDHALLVARETTPGYAKQRGRGVDLRPDWETIKFDVMRKVIRAKFHHGRYEAEFLISTGDTYLIEGTYWNDRIWGVDLNTEGHPGANWLGRLLMERRKELSEDAVE